jgi:hypothetical protein
MLSAWPELLAAAGERLESAYGPLDLRTDVMPWDFTHYYDDEMGVPLHRQLVAAERLISPEQLGPIKQATNAIEAAFAAEAAGRPPRPVNLDPGYVTESKLVLASTKDFAHRIYLGGGIFAEVTLTYARGRWVAHEHTFPDYASGAYDAFLTEVRNRLHQQLKAARR